MWRIQSKFTEKVTDDLNIRAQAGILPRILIGVSGADNRNTLYWNRRCISTADTPKVRWVAWWSRE